MCGNTTPAGRSVFTKFRVFPISTSVDITVYQHGKNALHFFYNIAKKNTKLLQCMSGGKFSVFISSYVNTALDQSAIRIHKCYVIKKVSRRLYFLVQLKRAKLPSEDLVQFYITCIRAVIDYAIPAFYHSLPQYLKSELIRLEKRALSIIIPREDYQTATNKLGIKPLQIHHEHLCEKLFQAAIFDPSHKISKLLPRKPEAKYDLRKNRTFEAPRTRTN